MGEEHARQRHPVEMIVGPTVRSDQPDDHRRKVDLGKNGVARQAPTPAGQRDHHPRGRESDVEQLPNALAYFIAVEETARTSPPVRPREEYDGIVDAA